MRIELMNFDTGAWDRYEMVQYGPPDLPWLKLERNGRDLWGERFRADTDLLDAMQELGVFDDPDYGAALTNEGILREYQIDLVTQDLNGVRYIIGNRWILVKQTTIHLGKEISA